MTEKTLSGRIAIITGGAQGFGLSIAKKFLDSGAEVIAWDIDKSNSLDLNLFDKELSDFNFNIKKELYKDKLIIISDVNAMMKILQLMDNLNMIHRFFINIKVIDSIPNTTKLYQIIIS